MHNVVVEKAYEFVPPYPGELIARLLQASLPRRLNHSFGIIRVECEGLEKLRQSHREGHGILIAPNHCRPADPFVIAEVARRAGMLTHIMASSHLFAQGKLQRWFLQRSGAFSVYREGVDRQAISAATSVLQEAKRPLVIFPEGVITRTNARLVNLMEGTAFIARNAAKKRAQEKQGKVVVHPVALNYFFRGDIKAAVTPALDNIERRLSWRLQHHLPLTERIRKAGSGLLSLKEIDFLGQAQTGTIGERLARLIDHLLVPMEKQWLKEIDGDATVVDRVKKLRAAILPEMIEGKITPEERERRWRQLADMYLAQQLSCYPPDYLTDNPTPERMLETVERFEEDLTDECRTYRPMTVTARIGDAIVVPPGRDRGAAEDPVMAGIESQLRAMIVGAARD